MNMTVHKLRSEKKPTARKVYPIPPPSRISLSLNEVCGLCGIGMTTVRKAIEAEMLPARRLGKKRCRRISEETAVRFQQKERPKERG